MPLHHAVGAARVALGPELPAVFSNNDDTWQQLEAAARAEVRHPCLDDQLTDMV
jgi:hypothetical protein